MSTPRLLLATAFALASLATAAATAHAEARTVAIDELTATVDGSVLMIGYDVDPGDWRGLRRARIVPTLNVRGAYLPPATAEVRRAHGQLTFQLPAQPAPFDEVDVWFTGGADGKAIGGMRLGNLEVRRVTLPVVRVDGTAPVPAAPPPARPPIAAAVINACAAAFDGATNQAACLAAVENARIDPQPAITVCDAAFDGDTNELACLQAVVRGRADGSAAVRACEASFDGDPNELRCVQYVASAMYEPSAAITACEAAGNGDPNELACVAAVASARRNPTEAIRACDQTTSDDEAMLSCVRRRAP